MKKSTETSGGKRGNTDPDVDVDDVGSCSCHLQQRIGKNRMGGGKKKLSRLLSLQTFPPEFMVMITSDDHQHHRPPHLQLFG